jgi:diguanylate cyclase (GGDEF)-like protein
MFMKSLKLAEHPIPTLEKARLTSLRSLKHLDTPAEERFERITRLARKHFNLPIAALSLVDDERQWFKSIQGLCAPETSRDVSFCHYTIMNCSEALVVNDARTDSRFAHNPRVIDEPRIVFYAGWPVRAPDGEVVASFCVIGNEPRSFSPDDTESLRDFAALAECELANMKLGESQKDLIDQVGVLEVKAHVDTLTRLWNRGAIVDILSRECARSERTGSSFAIIMLDIDHFKSINDTYGHVGGDDALRRTAQEMSGAVREYDAVGRYGGEEFLVVAPNCSESDIKEIAERIRKRIEDSRPKIGGERVTITASLGTAVWTGTQTGEELLALADTRLYQGKENGRNRVVSEL